MTESRNYRSEVKATMAIAWPTIIAQLAQMGTGVVDTLMAGHYGAEDLAAIAVGYNIWLPIYLFALGVLLSHALLVAQDFGAGRLARIRSRLVQALWLAALLGMLAGPACYFTAPLLAALQLEAGMAGKALDYLQAVAFGIPATALFLALRYHTQGLGIMRPFAVASVIGFLANIPLNYALIYGRWGAPEMGAEGCGWATAISMWLGPILIAAYMLRSRSIRPYLPRRWRMAPRPARMAEMFLLGLPVGITFTLEIGIFTVVSLMIATLGSAAMAAHQIAYNVWDVVYMPLISIGSAMATRVGHAIGAGDQRGLMLAVRTGIALTLLVGVVCSVLLLTLPELLISAYTDERAIHSIALRLVGLLALFVMIDSLQVATSYCLRAFQDTRFPFLATCLCYWLFGLPLAWWLGLGRGGDAVTGTTGVWTALITAISLSCVLICARLYYTLRKPAHRLFNT